MSLYRNIVYVLLVACIVLLPGCNSGTEDDKKDNDTKEENKEGTKETSTAAGTPEDAHATAKKAAADKDWKTFAACFSEKTQDEFIGMMVIMGSFATIDDEVDDKKKEAIAAVKKVFDDHGLTEEKMKEMESDENPQGPPNFSGLIKDKVAFIGAMIPALEKMVGQDIIPFNKFANSSISDVKVDGDTAKANFKIGGRDDKIEFVKVDGSWKIQTPETSGSSE